MLKHFHVNAICKTKKAAILLVGYKKKIPETFVVFLFSFFFAFDLQSVIVIMFLFQDFLKNELHHTYVVATLNLE